MEVALIICLLFSQSHQSTLSGASWQQDAETCGQGRSGIWVSASGPCSWRYRETAEGPPLRHLLSLPREVGGYPQEGQRLPAP